MADLDVVPDWDAIVVDLDSGESHRKSEVKGPLIAVLERVSS